MFRKIIYIIFLLIGFTSMHCSSTKNEEMLLSESRVKILSKIIPGLLELDDPPVKTKIYPLDLIQSFQPFTPNEAQEIRQIYQVMQYIKDWYEVDLDRLIAKLEKLPQKNEVVNRFLFQSYLQQGSFKKAKAVGDKIAHRDTTVRLMLGVSNFQIGQYNEALEYFLGLEKEKAFDDVIHEYIGNTYFQLANSFRENDEGRKKYFNKAIEEWREGLPYSKNPEQLRYYIGTTYYIMKDYNKAVENFRQCYSNRELAVNSQIYVLKSLMKTNQIETFAADIKRLDDKKYLLEDICGYVAAQVTYYYLMGQDYWQKEKNERNIYWEKSEDILKSNISCLEQSLELAYVKAMISLLTVSMKEISDDLKLKASADLNFLYKMIAKNSSKRIDYSMLCKQVGNIAFLYGFNEFSTQFYQKVKKKDEITYANILAVNPYWHIDRDSVGERFRDQSYRFFISIIEENARLSKSDDPELFTNVDHLDSLFYYYKKAGAQRKKIANLLLRKYLAVYQEKAASLHTSANPALKVDLSIINEKAASIISKLDSISNDLKVPEFLPIEDNQGKLTDILIMPVNMLIEE